MTATLTLAQQRTAREAKAQLLAERLAGLAAERPAAALDDPKQLEELDGQRSRIQAEMDHNGLALEELGRREVAEQQAQVERERKALAAQLQVTLAARMKHTGSAVVLAEQLGVAVGTVAEDERFAFEMARRVGVESAVRSVVPTLRNVVVGRLQALPDLLPRVRPPDLERHERLLADLLAMKPV